MSEINKICIIKKKYDKFGDQSGGFLKDTHTRTKLNRLIHVIPT